MRPTVLIDARLAAWGLGMASVGRRLVHDLAARDDIHVRVWQASSRFTTLARSGLFDVSPRLDPRSGGYDVYHYLSHLSPVVPGKRSVLTLHDLMFLERSRPRDRVMALLMRRGLGLVRQVVCASGQTESEALSLFPTLRGRTVVIPWGWTPREFTGTRDHLVAFGGSADPRKRTSLIARVFEQYRRQTRNPLPLYVFGRGISLQDRESLENVGGVVLTAADDEAVRGLIASAAAMIYPTRREGFGLPIVEAAEVGTPVVVARNSQIPSEVRGKHLFYADQDLSLGSWVSALTLAIECGPVPHALDLPLWSEVAERYAAVYHSVL